MSDPKAATLARAKNLLSDKPRGWRGEATHKHENPAQHMVEMRAGQVLELCGMAKDPHSEIVKAQTMGCSALPPETLVALQADCLHHLVENAGS